MAKITHLKEGCITFDDGSTLSSHHEQSCCEIFPRIGQVIFKILIKLVYEQPHNRKSLSFWIR